MHFQTKTFLLLSLLVLGACAGKADLIPGTKIPSTDDNRRIINRVEQFRAAIESKDAAGILMMASEEYWEDSGSPKGEDDYGYEGLQAVLSSRFQRADSIRYSMRYVRIRHLPPTESAGPRAFVDVLVDASFTIPDARGGVQRTDKRDQNQFVLEWNGEKWMFLSGM